MLVHIVPSVPPAVNGLGDYCYKLWENWPSPRPAWHCIAPSVSEDSRSHWPEVGLSTMPLNRDGLLRALEEAGATTVVLHYVGYGYHPKGCPTWLPPSLREWKQRSGGQLVVMFHELYNNLASPWQTSYWLVPVARKIVKELAAICDQWITSCTEYQSRLASACPKEASKGHVIPIGANITPTSEIDFDRLWPLTYGRKLKIVVFGLPNTRLWALTAHQQLLKLLCERGLVEQILLLGMANSSDKNAQEQQEIMTGIGYTGLWRQDFDLSQSELSQRLSTQDLGIVANWPGVLTKSLVYANLCAHGVIPVASHHEKERSPLQHPCVVNNDARHASCTPRLQDEEYIRCIKSDLKMTAEGLLNWTSITRQWTKIIN